MPEDLNSSVQRALDLATKAGAQHAKASASRSREVEYSFRDGNLEKVQESTSRGLSLELFVDGRYSSHSTTDLGRLDSFIPEAVALTRALQPDEFRQITPAELYEGRSDAELQLADEGVGAIDQAKREAWCKQMDEVARAHAKVISATSGVQTGQTHSVRAHTNGFLGETESTSVWVGTEVTVQGEGDKRPEDWMWAGARHVADIPDPVQLATTAREGALRRLGTVKGPTGKLTMVVDRRAAGRLLGLLLGPATGGSVQQKRSYLAGKVGQKLFSDKLSITDDPLRVRGLASRHFDGEGISAKKLPIIEAGVLRNFYVDTYYGRKLGIAPTTGGASNQVLALGDKDALALCKAVKKGIYVTSWLGGNGDGTTGDFSLGLRGHLIENGEVAGPVGEMNVTGNLVPLFERLAIVGGDPWPYSSLLAPSLVFEGVDFSGA